MRLSCAAAVLCCFCTTSALAQSVDALIPLEEFRRMNCVDLSGRQTTCEDVTAPPEFLVGDPDAFRRMLSDFHPDGDAHAVADARDGFVLSDLAQILPPSVEATRRFSTPEQIPPENFAAYAIFATNVAMQGEERDRYIAICRGYYRTLLQADTQMVPPPERQLVTVWPVETEDLATRLNALGDNTNDIQSACEKAVDAYHHAAGKQAIRDARRASGFGRVHGRGPFLFAWNPSTDKGERDRPLFRMNLSNVRTEAQAMIFFDFWQVRVVSNPDAWTKGWSDPGTRIKLKLAIENNASDALAAMGQLPDLIGFLLPGSD